MVSVRRKGVTKSLKRWNELMVTPHKCRHFLVSFRVDIGMRFDLPYGKKTR